MDYDTPKLGLVLQHLGGGRYRLLEGVVDKSGKAKRGIEIEGYYETLRLFFESKFGHADELEVACQQMDEHGQDKAYFGIFGLWLFGEKAANSDCLAV